MTRQTGIHWLLAGLAALCVFVTHCGQMDTTTTEAAKESTSLDASTHADKSRTQEEGSETPVEASRFTPNADEPITYTLKWSWNGATWDKESKTYLIKNDKGFTFGIQSGYVGIAAMQLVVCEDSREIQPTMGSLFRRFPFRFGFKSARADHNFTNDSSFAGNLLAEVMFNEKEEAFGKATASGSPYCQLHVLYVPLNQDASDGFALKRSSIHFKGWYQAPGSTEKVEMNAKVHLQGGGLVPLYASKNKTPRGEGMFVDVIRYPARSFQGIDPAKLVDLEIAQKVLLQLSQTTRAEIQQNP